MAGIPDPSASVALGAAATAQTGAGKTAVATGYRPGTRRVTWAPPYLFPAVPLALYGLRIIGPMFFTFWTSLTDTDGLTGGELVGLDNDRRLYGGREFWFAFWDNVRWLPALSTVVISAVWSWMYFPSDGLINTTRETIGYDGRAIPFLADYTYDGVPLSWLHDLGRFTWVDHVNLVSWSIIGAGIRRQIGYIMLIYPAGLKNVDTTLVEASRADGDSAVRSFKGIVLPQLQPVTVIVVVISIIDALRAFDLVNLMTDGGPAIRSTVLAHRMHEGAFNNDEMGIDAVALSVFSGLFIFGYLLFVLPLVLTWLVPLATATVTSVKTLDELVANGPWALPERFGWSNFRHCRAWPRWRRWSSPGSSTTTSGCRSWSSRTTSSPSPPASPP